MLYRELSNEQRRQWLDFMQVDEAYRLEKIELIRRFSGSMRWIRKGNVDYLHAKKKRVETSLGPRSAESESIYNSFIEGRAAQKDRTQALQLRLKQMAPVNRALGLGRVPKITALILRKLHDARLLGTHYLVAGTNALWAYEAKAGVQIQSDLVATLDADLLWDPRLGIKLVPKTLPKDGIIGLLQKVDNSFKMRGKHDFKAINKFGFSVDIIRPEDRLFFKNKRDQISEHNDDLAAAPIFGLQWLLNSPRIDITTIAEDGLSVPISTFDPRAFSLHKLWLSGRDDRDPIKAKRDLDQAKLIAEVSTKYLGLNFDSQDLKALPKKLRDLITKLI